MWLFFVPIAIKKSTIETCQGALLPIAVAFSAAAAKNKNGFMHFREAVRRGGRGERFPLPIISHVWSLSVKFFNKAENSQENGRFYSSH